MGGMPNAGSAGEGSELTAPLSFGGTTPGAGGSTAAARLEAFTPGTYPAGASFGTFGFEEAGPSPHARGWSRLGAGAADRAIVLPAPANRIPEGSRSTIRPWRSLDVPNFHFSSGVVLQEWTCNHTNAQKWNVLDVSSAYFQVQSAARPDLCLNNWFSGGAKGDYIKRYSCSSVGSRFNIIGGNTWDHSWNGYNQFQPKAASVMRHRLGRLSPRPPDAPRHVLQRGASTPTSTCGTRSSRRREPPAQ
jgi:hypothetical protein